MDRVYFTINGKKYSGKGPSLRSLNNAFINKDAPLAMNSLVLFLVLRKGQNTTIKFLFSGNAGGEFSLDTTLNEFIRRHADLRGTKYMCQEGGCGTCVVNVRIPSHYEGEYVSFAVNSCLVVIMSCDNWEITTVEGIGNRKIGYNVIQKRLNHFFGSQCGYCSPGFVMSMYSLLQAKHDLSEKEIEESFGSNLCRCTGYRPILEAFKSLAVDKNPAILQKIKDIEDIDKHVCPKSGKNCNETCTKEYQEWCMVNVNNEELPEIAVVPKQMELADGKLWFTADNVNTIFETLDKVGYESYMLIAGNTAKGVRPIITYPKVLIDISKIKELQTHYLDVNLVLGANMTITDTMKLFLELCESNEDFWYLKVLYDHIERVAHIPVRNIGTLAGNLVLKHDHPDFQSDIFLLLDCVGAVITLVDRQQQKTELTLPQFLKANLVGKVLTQIKLPPLSKQYKLVTYKITPREQNAHAEVNSGFLFKFDHDSDKILEARIVYGGITPYFTHAYETEKYLIGRYIFDNYVLQEALHCLQTEIHPVENPPDPSPSFKRKLAVNLFYKCILRICPLEIVNPYYKSGSTTPSEDRPPVSHSYQEYDTDKKDYPITQPLLKREGIYQCAGEAVYSDDMPTMHNEVFASFALCTVTRGVIESIDASHVLKIDGVITVLTSADIPGMNNFMRIGFFNIREREEILASDEVRYYNQPVAIVVAKTQAIADRAANFVTVNYKSVIKRPLVLTIEDAIKSPKDEHRLVSYPGIMPTDRGTNVKKVIRGTFYSPLTYHCMMELHTIVTKPVDDRLEVHVSTQALDLIQAGIAQVLNVPESFITVITRRCGGAFGCKISRQNMAACAAAIVSKKLNKPCRMAMRLPDIMRALGKRCSSRLDYEIGVDENGEIQYMNATFYVNDGTTSNENENSYATESLKSCYDFRRWKVDSFGVLTDTPSNTYMRAPGGYEGIAAIEHIMDHIAIELKKDPVSVRMVNFRKEDNAFPKLLPKFLKRVKYYERQKLVQHFNDQNRWKKRALKFNLSGFPVQFVGNYSALVSVSHSDGSVIVSIGGVEIGQGIFTRIAQVAADEFHLPVEKVAILPVTNVTTPNNYATGSSITIECCAYSVIRSCQRILKRLAPVRAAMPNATWQEIVYAADQQGINLQANYVTSPNDPRLIEYTVFGISAIEVEIDILTGRKWIVRADVFEDTGRSINPALDLGQVEGAFIQALGSWTMEEIKFSRQTGEVYTNRTWNYKIFGTKDIPHDFRVYLRRRAPNPVGILGSKAVGEPPVCLGYALVESLRAAIQCSRHDSGYDTDKYLCLAVPVTNENALEAADPKIEEYLLY